MHTPPPRPRRALPIGATFLALVAACGPVPLDPPFGAEPDAAPPPVADPPDAAPPPVADPPDAAPPPVDDPPFTPSEDALVLWLDATSGVVVRAGTDVVSVWRDRRGGAGALEADAIDDTLRPTLVPGALGGRAVVRFDHDNLVIKSFAGLKGDDYTVVVVLRPTTAAPHGILATRHLEWGSTFWIDRVSPTTYRYTHKPPFGTPSGDTLSAELEDDDAGRVLVARRRTADGARDMRLQARAAGRDGVTADSVTLVEPALSGFHTLRIGDATLVGDLAEILIYDRGLTDDELALLLSHLSAKWGL